MESVRSILKAVPIDNNKFERIYEIIAACIRNGLQSNFKVKVFYFKGPRFWE